MQVELLKLAQIAPQPLNLSFPLGYLASLLPLAVVATMRRCFVDLIEHVDSREVLKILLFIKEKWLPSVKKGEEMQLQSKLQAIVGWIIFNKDFNTNSNQLDQTVQLQPAHAAKIECLVCAEEIDQNDACSFSCQHIFHKSCFESYSKERIFAKNLPIRCPIEECAMELPFQQISGSISQKLQTKLNEFMFQSYVEHKLNDTDWCPTPGCQVAFQNQGNIQEFRCPSCRNHYCLQCSQGIHRNMSCQQSKRLHSNLDEGDWKFMQMAKKQEFKQCPSCHFWVEKTEGCDHMTCRCKYEFCYICGGEYENCECQEQGQYQGEEEYQEEEEQCQEEEEEYEESYAHSERALRQESCSQLQEKLLQEKMSKRIQYEQDW